MFSRFVSKHLVKHLKLHPGIKRCHEAIKQKIDQSDQTSGNQIKNFIKSCQGENKDNLAAVLYDINDLRLEQRPIPEIGPKGEFFLYKFSENLLLIFLNLRCALGHRLRGHMPN